MKGKRKSKILNKRFWDLDKHLKKQMINVSYSITKFRKLGKCLSHYSQI